jgi:DNA repair exonuclease SbcCD ATPase subunit
MEMIAHKVVSMERSLDKLTEAITKLAIIEERQSTDRAALERAFAAIQAAEERSAKAFEKAIAELKTIEGRVDVLEQAAPMTAQTSQWVKTAVWSAAAAAAVYAAKRIGLI